MKNILILSIICTMFLGCSRTYKSKIVLQDKLSRTHKLVFLDQSIGFCIAYYGESRFNNECDKRINVDQDWFGHPEIGHLLVTENGGKDWAAIKAPLYTVESYSFIDKLHGWISGGWADTSGQCHTGILHTIDGGKTFELQANFLANDLFFFDEQIGYAIGDNSIILRTDDGGKNWSQKTIKETNNNAGTRSANLRNISFSDKNFGMISGENLTLLVTEDGGETWEQMIDKRSRSYGLFVGDFKHFSIASKKSIWAILGNNDLFHYDGSSWKQFSDKDFLKMGLLENCQSKPFYYNGFIYDISFSDKNNGWVIGEGHIFYTQNGGKKWKSFPLKINENTDIDYCRDDVAKSMKYKQISVLKDNSCFIAGGNSYGVQSLFKIE